MIHKIAGILEHLESGIAVIDVGGLGYGVEVPDSSIDQSTEIGQEVSLWIHTYVKEDAIRLFGFRSNAEKKSFLNLISISGVGPKVALAILSRISVDELRDIALTGDSRTLLAVPGIGKKLAEKLSLELKNMVEKFVGTNDFPMGRLVGKNTRLEVEKENVRNLNDVKSALVNLGFKAGSLTSIIAKLEEEHAGKDFQELLRIALQNLQPKSNKVNAATLGEIF